MTSPRLTVLAFVLCLGLVCASAHAAKLVDVRPVDDEFLQVYWRDGEVEYKDTGTGPNAFRGLDSAGDVIHRFAPPLDTAAVVNPDSYELTSKNDPKYAAATHPTAAYRKTKVNGTDRAWPDANYTLEHTVYLKLPQKLQQDGHYTLTIAPAVKSDTASRDFTFDIYSGVSEAVHVNLIGYNPAHTAMKSADLYMWLGDGGGRDYSTYAGRKVISIIWDMLLPYLLSNGKLADDNCQIRESGNGIPDLIDEARYEVDFWLRLREGKGGYAAGLNNPGQKDTVMYQAGASPYMAWASAANAAMLADAFRIARKTDLANKYRDAAVEAWKTAGDQGLDLSAGIGNGQARGRDLKMMAAAFLYNVTGDTAYEDAMAKESVVTGPTSGLDKDRNYCQYWGTAAYLLCAKNNWRPIHNPKLLENMKAAILHEAMQKNVSGTARWPSRRASDNAYGWFQTTQEVQAACIAHAVATEAADKDALLKALILEADYGLGRNPLNMVQMSGLGSRCVEQMFTTGRNDGVPGVHPGHTPYMNAAAWGGGYMADPQWYASKGYPAWKDWPQGEALWCAPYCYSNNEFTPQQSMRGKMCLLGYLYSLGDTRVGR